MKKQLIAVMFALALSFVINAGQTFAQSQAFRVTVPFDFSVNNKTLPKGTYIVNPATDNRLMWRVEGTDDQAPGTLLVAHPSTAEEPGNLRMTFRRYGERYFLIGFKTTSYDVAVPMSGSEKDLRRSAGINFAKLITLETK
jgi:hypothetical protein